MYNTYMLIRLHFNKQAMQRGDPRVWSLITSKACYHAKSVVFKTRVVTEFNPNKKRNPRAFLTAVGNITMLADGTALIE